MAVGRNGDVDGSGLIVGQRGELCRFGAGEDSRVQRDLPAKTAKWRGTDLGKGRAELGSIGGVEAGVAPVQLVRGDFNRVEQ